MNTWIVKHRARLGGVLILTALFAAYGLTSLWGEAKPKPDLKIRSINSSGPGPKKIKLPRESRTYYTIGNSQEKIFTVEIKNRSKEQKKDVRVKLFAYDKKEELIREESPHNLSQLYKPQTYSPKERILQRGKTVELYFTVNEKARYLKAELFCGDELIDVKTKPKSLEEPSIGP